MAKIIGSNDIEAPLFPSKPKHWIVRGVYRDGGLKGQSCSCSVYTVDRCSASRAREIAESEKPWMIVKEIRLVGA